jgi:hypothetical protein
MGRAERGQSEMKFALFDALTIVNEFLFTVWILGAICLLPALFLLVMTGVR